MITDVMQLVVLLLYNIMVISIITHVCTIATTGML